MRDWSFGGGFRFAATATLSFPLPHLLRMRKEIQKNSPFENPFALSFSDPKISFFRDLGFPSVILAKKSLKAPWVSSKMVYQHLLFLFYCGLIDIYKVYPGSNFRCKFLRVDFITGLQWAETAVNEVQNIGI